MTTIVATRDMIAGDTLLSGDNTCNATKVFKHKGAVVGIAGTYACCMDFVRWWKAGGNPESIPDMEEVDAVVLTVDGKILCFNHHNTFFEINDAFTALGSGAAAALGALHAGASPQKAIKIASRIDPATGSTITIRRRGKKHA